MYIYTILVFLPIVAVSVVVNAQGKTSTQLPSVPTTLRLTGSVAVSGGKAAAVEKTQQHSDSQTPYQAQVEGTKVVAGEHIQAGPQGDGAHAQKDPPFVQRRRPVPQNMSNLMMLYLMEHGFS